MKFPIKDFFLLFSKVVYQSDCYQVLKLNNSSVHSSFDKSELYLSADRINHESDVKE